jgi:protein TonB
MPGPDFDDLIFEKLNKEYGAYFLRKGYKRVVSVAIIAACSIVIGAVLIPFLMIPEQKSNEIYTMKSVMIENLDAPVEKVYIPPAPANPVTVQADPAARIIRPEARYVAPEVVDSIIPDKENMILTADSLSGIIPGQENIKGSGNESGGLTGTEGGDGTGRNGLYTAVDEMPRFRGGDINKFREWVQKKTKYPEIATINGIQGKVYVTFIVENDGSVTNVKVVRGVDPLINDEAVKAVMSSPKWTPGKQRGVAVRVSYIISLNFQL